VARGDHVIALIATVECARVTDAKVKFESRLLGFPRRAFDHLWRKINACDGMPEFGEPEGKEAGSTSDVQNLLQWSPR
jgi:hypothetical protein